ncbi:hypothetical protein PTTG_02697, partial [Puccinia triticina 1-1 BBBD Race 1]
DDEDFEDDLEDICSGASGKQDTDSHSKFGSQSGRGQVSPQADNSSSNNKNQNGRRKPGRGDFLEESSLDYYAQTHPAVVGPRHPDSPPVRHPRALTLIIREGLTKTQGLGTPARPREDAQGVLRNRTRDGLTAKNAILVSFFLAFIDEG